MATAHVKSSLRTLGTILGAVFVSLFLVAVPGAEATHVEPEFRSGNPTCEDFQPSDESWTEFKIEGASDGGGTEGVDTGTYSDGTLTVEVTVRDTEDGPVFDWDANLGVDAVFSKGGPHGNLYVYDPEALSDDGLHSPLDDESDTYFGLSHISFCYDVPADIDLVVDKVNDANDDGAFTDSETAPAPGADVDFRITVSLPESAEAPVELDAATDTYPTGDDDTSNDTEVSLFEECDELSGETVLDPGESVSCTFTLTGYAPPAGESLMDTVAVAGHEQGNQDNTTSADDTSTVDTPAEEVGGDEREREDGATEAQQPAIDVTKTALVDPDDDGRKVVTYVPGDGDEETVAYRYEVTNTGDTTLHQVQLTDDVLGTITLDDTELAPGESTTATATHVLSAADVADGEVVNVATAVATSPQGEQVSATDDAMVLVAEVQSVSATASDVDSAVEGDEQLPATGADPTGWALLAIALLALGGAALLATRPEPSRG